MHSICCASLPLLSLAAAEASDSQRQTVLGSVLCEGSCNGQVHHRGDGDRD